MRAKTPNGSLCIQDRFLNEGAGKLGHAVVDSTISVASTTPVAGGASSGGGGGGGAAGYVLLLSLLAGCGLQRRRRLALTS